MDLQDIFSNPEFNQLPLGERLKVARQFPDFSGLPAKDQGTVLYNAASQFHPAPAAAPSTADSGVLDSIKKGASTLGQQALSVQSGIDKFLAHPLDTITGAPKAIGKSLAEATAAREALAPKAEQAYKEGHPIEAAGYYAASKMPFVGPAAAQAGEELGAGEYGKGTVHAAELLLPFLIKGKTSEAEGAGAEAVPQTAKAPLPPNKPPQITGKVRAAAQAAGDAWKSMQKNPVSKAVSKIFVWGLEKKMGLPHGSLGWLADSLSEEKVIPPETGTPVPGGRFSTPGTQTWTGEQAIKPVKPIPAPEFQTPSKTGIINQGGTHGIGTYQNAPSATKVGDVVNPVTYAARQYAADHGLDYDALDKTAKSDLEALVQSFKQPPITAPKTPTPGGAPPPADPNFKPILGPAHAEQLRAVQEADAAKAAQRTAAQRRTSVQNELEQALASTGVKPSAQQIEALRAAQEEFTKPVGIPQPQVAPPATERPTIKDENGIPIMYADNPPSAPATSGAALPAPVTPPAPAAPVEPPAAAVTPKPAATLEAKGKVGRKTTEQTASDMAEALRGTKLEAFLKENPGATIADYVATNKGRQEIQNFLKSTAKPAKGLESPVKATKSKSAAKPETKAEAPKPEEKPDYSAQNAEQDKEHATLPANYKSLKTPERLTEDYQKKRYQISAFKADSDTLQKLIKGGKTLEDWKNASAPERAAMRKEVGAKATENDPDGTRLAQLWGDLSKNNKTAEAVVGTPEKPVKSAASEPAVKHVSSTPVAVNPAELQKAEAKLGVSHATEFYRQLAEKDGLTIRKTPSKSDQLIRNGKPISKDEAQSWISRAHAALIDYAVKQPAVKPPLKRK